MESGLLDTMNQLSISEYNPRMKYCDKFQSCGEIESMHEFEISHELRFVFSFGYLRQKSCIVS